MGCASRSKHPIIRLLSGSGQPTAPNEYIRRLLDGPDLRVGDSPLVRACKILNAPLQYGRLIIDVVTSLPCDSVGICLVGSQMSYPIYHADGYEEYCR